MFRLSRKSLLGNILSLIIAQPFGENTPKEVIDSYWEVEKKV